ncbi:MAG: glycosyltransferase [Patescibacteria group bacterium]|nr:glycosyltransferase [Patescibacteria group bacterium]
MLKNLSIIIPARNEENNLARIIPLIVKKYHQHILEIIVVDDNSTDGTYLSAWELKKQYKKIKIVRRIRNPGVGLAIKEGIKNLSPKSEYVLFMDCDFLANVPDIANFIKKIDGFDGVTGSRFMTRGSLKNYPFIKLIANRSFHFLSQLIIGIPHSDLTNNFKLYRKNLVDKLYPILRSPNFAINAELGYYPVIAGASIGQIPVSWKERTRLMGLSKFKIFRVGPSYFLVFLRLIGMRLQPAKIRTIAAHPKSDSFPPKR